MANCARTAKTNKKKLPLKRSKRLELKEPGCGDRPGGGGCCAFLAWISTRCFISQREVEMLSRSSSAVSVRSGTADLDVIGLDAAACGSPRVAADSLWPSCRAFRYASRRFEMSDLSVGDSGLGEDAAA